MTKSAVALLYACLFCGSALAQLATYVGGTGEQAFHDVHALSDGSFLIAGSASDLDWVSDGVARVALANTADINNGNGSGQIAFLLHVGADLQDIRGVYSLPAGAAEDVFQIRGTHAPGQPTGTLFISGTTEDSRANGGGYFLARLDGNLVDGPLNGFAWSVNVWAQGEVQKRQPWDVSAEGEVSYVFGQSHGNDWAAVYRLTADGRDAVVPNWRTHWTTDGEHRGTAADYDGATGAIRKSGVVLKTSRCDLRSWTDAEYTAVSADGNGGTRQGTWPLDVLFDSHCDPADISTAGPGYTGYRLGGSPGYNGSALAVDRRTGWLYLGLNVKSRLPDGLPDFEPAVVAFAPDGALGWWSRLYHEITPEGERRRSTPDQYVDALAVDYSAPATRGNVVVTARCHGNNVENFWEGNTIAAAPDAAGFQNRFTGNSGNIHISYLAKLGAQTGTLRASTYLAEYPEGRVERLGGALSLERYRGWPDFNAGWPDVNTTRTRPNRTLATADGSVVVLGTARRTMTTADAYQQMPLPGDEARGSWNDFVRQYSPDLRGAPYSTVLTGDWDRATGRGGDNVALTAAVKTARGYVVVGFHESDDAGVAKGNPMPTTRVPAYGTSTPSGKTAVLARIESEAVADIRDGYAGTSTVRGLLPKQLRAWPNPITDGVLHLEGVAGEARVRLFDMLGRGVGRASTGGLLDLSGLASGTYAVHVDGHEVVRVVVE